MATASSRRGNLLSAVGLVSLGILAALLSGAALLQHRLDGASLTAEQSRVLPPQPSADAAASREPPPRTPSRGDAMDMGADPGHPPTVVVIGDSTSSGDPALTWVGPAAQQLGWGEVTNLSAPGRGFVAVPESCDVTPCATFVGSIGLIAGVSPDIVVTFGGTSDGDYGLAELADEYFAGLRRALPDAALIAISPVTGADEAPFWLTMHRDTIAAGVEASGGRMVDVGQPGVGDGDPLSASAYAEIARLVVEQLREKPAGTS